MHPRLNQYLKAMVTHNGSDLHLKSGSPPRARIHGKLKKMGDSIFSSEEMDGLAKAICSKEQYADLVVQMNLDISYVFDTDKRYRVNLFYQLNGLSGVFRIIPTTMPTLDELNLPPVIRSFTQMHRGLVLVTGVTGSGKSTTLSAIINQINIENEKHIITVEDPIEFIHQDKGCLVSQRGIGQQATSFSNALRGALREDPDIILVGEMRDLETIEMALHASNTGHLVFSTLHTTDAKETINRIVGMFENSEQNRIRMTLASVLEGIISQRLIPSKDGGRVAGIEVLKKTSLIEKLISENRDNEIPDALFEGKERYGTQTFDQALLDLYQDGKIEYGVMMENATNPSDLKLKAEGIGRGAIALEKTDEAPDVFGLKD